MIKLTRTHCGEVMQKAYYNDASLAADRLIDLTAEMIHADSMAGTAHAMRVYAQVVVKAKLIRNGFMKETVIQMIKGEPMRGEVRLETH